MIEYKSETEDNLIRLLIDYTYLKALEKDVVGIFVMPYYDDKNVFEIIQFFDYEPARTIDGFIDIGSDELRFICLNKNSIKNFYELSSCEILYDPFKILQKEKEKFISDDKIFSGSNQLLFSDFFKKRLHDYLNKKLSTLENYDNDQLYCTLVDFYYCALCNTPEIDDLNLDMYLRNIDECNMLHFFLDNPHLHKECLNEALRKDNNKNKVYNSKKRYIL